MQPAQNRTDIEAVYELEAPMRCPACSATVSTLNVVRMLRTRVNFTSSLPRRGCAFVCPHCGTLLSASIGSRVGI